MEPNKEKKSYGALIGSVIIIVILVLGGIYFWMSKQQAINPNELPYTEDSLSTTETDPALIELSDLEAELESGEANTNTDISDIE